MRKFKAFYRQAKEELKEPLKNTLIGIGEGVVLVLWIGVLICLVLVIS